MEANKQELFETYLEVMSNLIKVGDRCFFLKDRNIEGVMLEGRKIDVEEGRNNFRIHWNNMEKSKKKDAIVCLLLIHSKILLYKNKILSENLKDYKKEEECSICLENKCNVFIDCNHIFCNSCIIKLIGIQGNKCPLCRKTFHNVKDIEEDLVLVELE